MKTFDEVRAYLADYKKRYEAEGDDRVIAELKRIGKAAIEYAEEHKAPGNITYNQMEGFGYAVYFNGHFVKRTSGYLDDKKGKGQRRGEHKNAQGKWVKGAPVDRRGKRGRMEAMKFIERYEPTSKGYVLLIINAVWYSMIHEAKYGLPVLSEAFHFAEREIANSFNVSAEVEYILHRYED